jgi:hypothetical protein
LSYIGQYEIIITCIFNIMSRIGDVIVKVLALGVVDRKFEPQ